MTPVPGNLLNAAGLDHSLDAGLWRSEFMAPQEGDSESADSKSEPGIKRLPQFDSPNTRHSMALTIPMESLANGLSPEADDEDPATVSDWDNAVANPATGGKKSQQVPGPSITSYIVGLVSAIVIIGGLVSGK
ncbi:MAG: hypothetical protein JNL58_09615 [Planctomyces sp.]|nr:hypothetical protein [Planctomyces sp.]